MSRRNNSSIGFTACMGCIGVIVLLILGGLLLRKMLHYATDLQQQTPEPLPTVTETETPRPDPAPERTSGGNTGAQDGIQFGYACSPVGALGNAGDGRPAKCFMGKDGRARWGYDSNRG
ncbi:hypothetical protein OG784_31915 [Streptomyces sp. NBC_01617]|uniref:hypothetical protein n=1 Tax=unclassified Streptomyces TaxID=2593676 RepID=UPI00386CB773|nr:hypothetical protein OG987_32065 [Streptomyces sp. NBC_01620]WTE63056.1 hypothetical protein OG784_31915 [Streptomyces sp. NBC_01617]